MTTICTADLHFSANPRDSYRFQFLENALPFMVQQHGTQRVLVLGDITEQKEGHHSVLVNRLVDGFTSLAQSTDVIILRGNHDGLSQDVPFFRFLKHIPRVRWINEPTALKLRGLGHCLFLPHARRPEDWGGVELTGRDWYFCHQTFSGATSESGQKLEGFPLDLFGRGARVISGDVHVPQDVKLPGRGLLTYAGAPFHVKFGDAFEPRCLLIRDGGEVGSLPVPGPRKYVVDMETV